MVQLRAGRLVAAVALAFVVAGCTGGAVTLQSRPHQAGEAGPIPGRDLPRHDLTPGGINPKVTQANIHQAICMPGWSARQRPSRTRSATLKKRVMRLYGYQGQRPADYEGDHPIPISLGGDPETSGGTENFWPEPWAGPYGAKTKDDVEHWAYREVCDGRMTLAAAQQAFASNWYQAWVKAGRPSGDSGGGFTD
jgi:hypothetical protein